MAIDPTPGLRGYKDTLKSMLPTPVRTSLQSLVKAGTVSVQGPLTYNSSGFATQHNAEFLDDPRFQSAYAVGQATGSWGEKDVRWTLHVALWAASHAMNLAGDFVECGVNRGGLSSAILDYLDFSPTNKRFFLLDTFCGLVESQITNEERERNIKSENYGYSECYDDVVKTFSKHDCARIIRGMVPDTLQQVDADRVCYLSIDMNCLEPEIAAIEFFWGRLVTGATVVLDDYGSLRHIGQKHAFDEFAARHNTMVLSLPTGQGLLLKP